MKKTSRKSLIRKLDTLVRKIVLERTPSCVVCGAVTNLQPGHVFSRAHYATRWDLDNVWTQCRDCNFKHELNSWPFFSWFIGQFGKKALDKLEFKYRQLTHFKSSDLLALLDQLGGKGK